MKRYFRYVEGKKVFRLVKVGGLGMCVMLVVVIGNMVVGEVSVGRDIKDIEDIYVLWKEEYRGRN